MIYASREEVSESMASLALALQGGSGARLSPEESANNIGRNVVMLVRANTLESVIDSPRPGCADFFIDSVGCGLQITADGFILTAAHIIEDWIEDWRNWWSERSPSPSEFAGIALKSGYLYWVIRQDDAGYIKASPIDGTTICYDLKYDVALIKAVNGLKPSPLDFKIAEGLESSDDLRLLTRNKMDVSLYATEGGILRLSQSLPMLIEGHETRKIRLVYDFFQTDIPASSGNSGSPIINQDGALVGLVSAVSVPKLSDQENPEREGYATCSRITYALSLAYKLRRQVGQFLTG